MYVSNLNPILLHWNFLTIRWYGVLLALGALAAVLIIIKLFKKNGYSANEALDLCTWLIIGGLIGARLGEILFYEPGYYFSHPAEMIMINHGGLSSHGMTLGLLITFFLYCKIKKMPWKKIIDLVIIPIPLLATFIRVANFINAEILGKHSNMPWAVAFRRLGENPFVYRHPTQIYEALTALAVFGILYLVYKRYYERLPKYFIFYLFMFFYFTSRFLIEFLKEEQGELSGVWLTTGQWLSVPFIVWSVFYWVGKGLVPFRNHRGGE